MLTLSRRAQLGLFAGAFLAFGVPVARADTTAVSHFVDEFGTQLVAVINGGAANNQKLDMLKPTIEQHVDIAGIAKFSLGRYWVKASPAQQTKFVDLFHRVLLTEIAGHLGEYKGVSYVIKDTHPQGDDTAVVTLITRPNAPQANVEWIVGTKDGAPKVVDVVAEGTSMRLTRRNDYASFLNSHGGNIDALITAVTQKLDAGS